MKKLYLLLITSLLCLTAMAETTIPNISSVLENGTEYVTKDGSVLNFSTRATERKLNWTFVIDEASSALIQSDLDLGDGSKFWTLTSGDDNGYQRAYTKARNYEPMMLPDETELPMTEQLLFKTGDSKVYVGNANNPAKDYNKAIVFNANDIIMVIPGCTPGDTIKFNAKYATKSSSSKRTYIKAIDGAALAINGIESSSGLVDSVQIGSSYTDFKFTVQTGGDVAFYCSQMWLRSIDITEAKPIPADKLTSIVDIDFNQFTVDGANVPVGPDATIEGNKGSMVFTNWSNVSPTSGTDIPFEVGVDANGAKDSVNILRVGAGEGVVEFAANMAGTTNILRVSMDWWFGQLSGKYCGFYLRDAEGNNVAGINLSAYDGKCNYDPCNMAGKFGVGTFTVSARNANAAHCVESNKTNMVLYMDYGTKQMQMVTTTPKGTYESDWVAFDGQEVAKFILSSNYTNADRRSWFDNLKIDVIEAGVPTDNQPATPSSTNPDDYDNLIYIKNKAVSAGTTFELPIYMKNSVPMTGFQFDIFMTEGLSIAKDDDYYLIDLSTERTTTRNTNSFDSALQKSGAVRVLAGSTKSKTFEGTDGEVVVATVSAAEDLADGNYNVVLKNIIMSDAVGNTYKVDSSSAVITVKTLCTSITLDKSAASLNVGDTLTLMPTVQPGNLSNDICAWSSSDTSVVTVSSSGKVTAVGPGTAVITVKANDGSEKMATCSVTVKQPVTSIKLSSASEVLNVGNTKTLKATVYPTNASEKTITWNSSDTSVATVSTSGLVTAKAPGTTTITATATDGSGIEATCTITVNQPVTSITLSSATDTLNIGDTKVLTTTVAPANATDKTIVWSSSNTAVATVEDGVITAVNEGVATITATTADGSDLSAGCTVTVIFPVTDITQYDKIVYIAGTEAITGRKATLSLKMNNDIPITGFQCDVVMPEGINVAMDEEGYYLIDLSTERTTTKKTNTFDSALQSDGSIRILAGSTKSNAFEGNEGEVATITVDVSDGLEEGEYPMILRNVIMSGTDGTPYRIDAVKTILTISTYTVGDPNNDGSIDVGDYTSIANFILGTNSGKFIEKAADVYPDGEINVGDLTAEANLILYGSSTAQAKPRYAADGEATIYINDVAMTAGESVELSVKMKNDVPMTGFQFDVVMPEGLSIAKDEDGYYCIDLSTERTTTRNTNTFDSALQADGSVRVLAGSTKSKTFEGTDGEVCTITVKAAEGIAAGTYTVVLKNIVMSDATGKTYKVDRSEATVTIDSATGIGILSAKSLKNGKYLKDGKLVIIRNGKQYNAVGLEK